MHRGLRNIVLTQVLLVALSALTLCLFRGQWSVALGAAYGGGIALTNTLLAAWRAGRASAMAGDNAAWSTLTLYAGIVERFVFTLVAFGLGMGMLRLDPPAVLVAFGAAQLGYLAGGYRRAGHDLQGNR